MYTISMVQKSEDMIVVGENTFFADMKVHPPRYDGAGRLTSLYIWKPAKIKIGTDNLTIRGGVSFHKNGNIKSIHLAEKSTLNTLYGKVRIIETAYFFENGSPQNIQLAEEKDFSLQEFTITALSCRTKGYRPGKDPASEHIRFYPSGSLRSFSPAKDVKLKMGEDLLIFSRRGKILLDEKGHIISGITLKNEIKTVGRYRVPVQKLFYSKFTSTGEILNRITIDGNPTKERRKIDPEIEEAWGFFHETDLLAEDVELTIEGTGIKFREGTKLAFRKNNEPWFGKLAQDFSISIAGNAEVTFTGHNRFSEYDIKFHSNGKIQEGVLARPTEFTIGKNRVRLCEYISFDTEGNIISANLAEDTELITGDYVLPFAAGAVYYRHDNIRFYPSGLVRCGNLIKDCNVTLNGRNDTIRRQAKVEEREARMVVFSSDIEVYFRDVYFTEEGLIDEELTHLYSDGKTWERLV